jgi:hypothetical protein
MRKGRRKTAYGTCAGLARWLKIGERHVQSKGGHKKVKPGIRER